MNASIQLKKKVSTAARQTVAIFCVLVAALLLSATFALPVAQDDHEKALPRGEVTSAPNFPDFMISDLVVDNTDNRLKATDKFPNSEPSIAVNPENPDQIVVLAFSGAWLPNRPGGPLGPAPLWYSNNGGALWTKFFTIPAPPKVPDAEGCPCDQTVDYGRGGRLSATFLTTALGALHRQEENPGNVYTGTTTDPTNVNSWRWKTAANGMAKKTNFNRPGNADQPWLLVNDDPMNMNTDNVYVGYDDFMPPPPQPPANAQVSVAYNTNPPDFTVDNYTFGNSNDDGINPGHRLAVDPNTGDVYRLLEEFEGVNMDGSKRIAYSLNRSRDGGRTWCLPGAAGCPNGQNPGIVFFGNSFQPQPKFCTINALLGGIDHVAVDPNPIPALTVYVVRGSHFIEIPPTEQPSGPTTEAQPSGPENVIQIDRFVDDGHDGLKHDFFKTITPLGTAGALPSIAVAADSNHSVGVLYDTCDDNGVASGNFPKITAHLAVSMDRGQTFTDATLLTFYSPVKDDGNAKQRVLGDYQQLKTLGNTFYGVFSANGAVFGRPTPRLIDPVFVKTSVGP